jgi:Holliday junction resolvase RusA-like endonuclease
MRSAMYCVNVPPIAWKRAARNGNRMYDDQARDKVNFGLYLHAQHGENPLFSKPIKVEIKFYMPIPKTVKQRRNYHACAPDLDNLIKFVNDTMKEIVITDDRIICSLFAEKVYDKNPRTELIITEVE